LAHWIPKEEIVDIACFFPGLCGPRAIHRSASAPPAIPFDSQPEKLTLEKAGQKRGLH